MLKVFAFVSMEAPVYQIDNLCTTSYQTYHTQNITLPFHSHKWPRQNFSLQYQYSIKQAGDENREEYQLWDY